MGRKDREEKNEKPRKKGGRIGDSESSDEAPTARKEKKEKKGRKSRKDESESESESSDEKGSRKKSSKSKSTKDRKTKEEDEEKEREKDEKERAAKKAAEHKKIKEVNINDIMLIAALDGQVLALDSMGEELWRTEYPAFVGHQVTICCKENITATNPMMVIGNQKALFAAANGACIGLGVTTGEVVWTNLMKGMGNGLCSLSISDSGTSLFVGQQGRVMAIDTCTGATIWKTGLPRTGYDMVDLLYTSRAELDGFHKDEVLYAGSRGRIFCFNPSDGSVIWSANIKPSTKCHLCMAVHHSEADRRNRLFFSMHGRFGVLDAASGVELWQLRLAKLREHHSILPMLCTEEYCIVVTAGMVLCAEPRTGRMKWEKNLFFTDRLDTEQASLLYQDETIYVALCMHVVALDLEGDILWASYTPRIKSTCPTMFLGAFDMLFVCGGGECLCIDMETGEVGERFKPDFKGSSGSNIATMGHPTKGYTNMNQQPAQHAVTVLGAAKEDRVRSFEDRTKKFVPPADGGDGDYFASEKKKGSSPSKPAASLDNEPNPFAEEPEEEVNEFEAAFKPEKPKTRTRGQSGSGPLALEAPDGDFGGGGFGGRVKKKTQKKEKKEKNPFDSDGDDDDESDEPEPAPRKPKNKLASQKGKEMARKVNPFGGDGAMTARRMEPDSSDEEEDEEEQNVFGDAPKDDDLDDLLSW